MQAAAERAAMANLFSQPADDLPGMHHVARMEPWAHRLVRDPQTSRSSATACVTAGRRRRQLDDHHTSTTHRAGKRHDAVCGGEHWLAGASGEIDAAVPRKPRLRWRCERSQHCDGRAQRPSRLSASDGCRAWRPADGDRFAGRWGGSADAFGRLVNRVGHASGHDWARQGRNGDAADQEWASSGCHAPRVPSRPFACQVVMQICG